MKIYQDNKRMVLLTGLHYPSRNRKTGPMLQVWVLPLNESPINPKSFPTVCGKCPIKKGCYVVRSQAPTTLFRTYGERPVEPIPDQLHLGVRLTAYGDPFFIPHEIQEELVRKSPFAIGYTHMWRDLGAKKYPWLSASVHSVEEKAEANEKGWRTFRTQQQIELTDDETWCPYPERTCITCRKCAWQNMAVLPHGSRRKYV